MPWVWLGDRWQLVSHCAVGLGTQSPPTPHTHILAPHGGHRKGPWLQPSVWRRQLKFPRWAGSGWDEGKDAEFIVNIAERALYIPSNEQHGQIFKAYCWMKKVRNRSFIAQQNVLTTETTLEKKNKSCVFQSQIVTGRPCWWHFADTPCFGFCLFCFKRRIKGLWSPCATVSLSLLFFQQPLLTLGLSVTLWSFLHYFKLLGFSHIYDADLWCCYSKKITARWRLRWGLWIFSNKAFFN